MVSSLFAFKLNVKVASIKREAAVQDMEEIDLNKALENERALNAILRCAVSHQPLPELLGECLDILLRVSWLSLEPRGGVFLADREQRSLQLVAHRHLVPEILTMCERVPFGRCLCGRAAASRELLYAACVDDRHENRYPGIRPHGHYNVPIVDGDNVLGVMVLYLPHGHPLVEQETTFLRAVADVLALVIRHRRALADLEHLARTDELTGLPNRRHFFERLEQEWAEAERLDRDLSLILCDLDHFKRINDEYGHHAGDIVLQHVARMLRAICRRYDLPARTGGEELAVLLPGASFEVARLVAERLRTQIAAAEIVLETAIVRVTASFGVACRRAASDMFDLLRRCDRALYQAKRNGRNCIAWV